MHLTLFYVSLKYRNHIYLSIILSIIFQSNHYPPMNIKIKYAKSLVKLYPFLGDGTDNAYVNYKYN